MTHKLTRFALTELYNKPHLVTEASLLPILDYVDMRNLENFKFEEWDEEGDEDKEKYKPEVVNGVAVIKIHGSLSYRPRQTMCGALGTSYQGLLKEFDSAIEAGAKTIIFDVNSGGGEAYSCFSTANEIRRRADEAGVNLISFVDGTSASAAYAIPVVSDAIIAHPNAGVGSIGVLIALLDDSEAMKKEGYKRKFIAYPKDKVPYGEDGQFTDKFIGRLEKEVKELAYEFAEHVSKYTGLSTEEILSLDAQVFTAKEALSLGLINGIMDQHEFSKFVAENFMTNEWRF